MKKIATTFGLLSIVWASVAQVDSVKTSNDSDTTRIQLGGTKILIVEDQKDSTDVDWTSEDMGGSDKPEMAYWSGLDLGINILRTESGSTLLEGDSKWLDLDYARSRSVSWNILEKRIPIVKEYVGLVVGAGVTWNSYGLQKNVRIVSNTTAIPDTTFGIVDTTMKYAYEKNKIRMSYLKVPLLLHFNTSKDEDRNFHIALGVIGGWNMGTIWKTEYSYEGADHRDRTKADFNTTAFTADLTARIGYRDFGFFGTYSLTPLFDTGRAAKVFPMTVGISFIMS
jgi:hypothetical protein